VQILTLQLALDGPANQTCSPPQDGDGLFRGLTPFRQKLLLGHPALLPQAMKLDCIQFPRQTLRDVMRQCGVNVVTAQQDVIAYRNSFECNLAGLFLHRDECEIGGAAADVDHQHQITDGHQFAPVDAALDPGVEGSLRFFKQNDVAITRLLRGLEG
jgi:hypothetical protein